ncbi:MAG: NACHT domain-containing protein [Clostridia bacterium]|nr:NACHT domain-containing protein [Clostridia bacterium]
MGKTEYFICFRGDAEMGGAIGAELYRTLNDRYGKSVYFSSARGRTFGTNYRKEEERAIDECETFIIVLTDYFIEGLTREQDEVLYELKTITCYPDKKIIAVAHKSFNWSLDKKALLESLLGKEKAERLYYIDYITYEGARSYADYTEGVFVKALGLDGSKPIISEVAEIKRMVIELELEKLKKVHASSTLAMKMDTIINGYFVEPKLTLNGEPLLISIEDLVKRDSGVTFISGESGSGKSTLMYRLFSNVAQSTQSDDTSTLIPIFKSLNNVKELDLDYRALVESILTEGGLSVDSRALEAFINNTSPVYIYDALDEKSPELSSAKIESAISGVPSNARLVISMRQSFLKSLYSPELSEHVDNVIGVKPFDSEGIERYAVNFLVKARDLEEDEAVTIVNRIKGQKIFGKILVLTYYLATMDTDEAIEDGIINVTSALGGIINRIIKREREKKLLSLNEEQGTIALKALSWAIYSTKRKKLLSREKLATRIVEETSFDERDVRALLDIFTVEQESGTLTFIHEMFKEYLIARDFVDRLMDEDEVLYMLDRTFNKEINSFIADLFEEEGVDDVYEALTALYDEIGEEDYIKVLSVFNHLHRLNRFQKVTKFVRKICEGTDDVAMRILCLHSLLACGDESDEQKYYEEFISNERFALLNCGMALRYYNDDRTDIEIPYYDDGELSWRKCFISYKAHLLNENKLKHYYRIRRINILSAKKFIEVRREVDSDVAEFYRSVDKMLLRDDSPFGKLVYSAYLELIATIEKYES